MRQYDFMLAGLRETEQALKRLDIPFRLLTGEPGAVIPRLAREKGLGCIVTDFNPLRLNLEWKQKLVGRLKVPLYEVDAHNIVPAWVASDKQEYGAYTIRPKINRLLADFLEDFPAMRRHRYQWPGAWPENDWDEALRTLEVDKRVGPVSGFVPGEKGARLRLRRFLERGLAGYADNSSNPALDGVSRLSPYLHFGQLSAQKVALDMLGHGEDIKSQESFLEELIIRRELADNFCLYNGDYDNPRGFPAWAARTLEEHGGDRREHLYGLPQLEKAATHDPLWNAAQLEMVKRGHMHGYMRMYWAKKILEWTSGVQEAMRCAIYLNDRYQLDGRDPNGYTGIAWSIGGVHDRAWAERPVFGKVRYMSYNGARRKFDVDAYIRIVEEL
jgi:deoxyribodipyrimidine photo-lyase